MTPKLRPIFLGLVFFSLILLLFSCDNMTGKEVGRMRVNAISTPGNFLHKEDSVYLAAGETLNFWSEMNVEYAGNISLLFKLKIWKDGEQWGVVEVNPFEKNITIGETKTTVAGKTHWKFTGKSLSMNFPQAGEYKFSAILVQTAPSEQLKLKKAELVLRK